MRIPAHRPDARADAHGTPPRRAGFTLLELLIVITMMIFITTIAVVNYFGAMRAFGYTAVSNDVFSTLLMARQRACIDNRPVFFYLLDTTNYVLQQAIGTITYIDPGNDSEAPPPNPGKCFYDKYGDSFTCQSNSPLVNMTNPGAKATVYKVSSGPTTFTNPVTGLTYPVPSLKLQLWPTGVWKVGDQYGTELFARQKLPKGFEFDLSTAGGKNKIVFYPDGTVDIVNGLSTLVVREMLVNTATNRVTFTIEASGKITQGK